MSKTDMFQEILDGLTSLRIDLDIGFKNMDYHFDLMEKKFDKLDQDIAELIKKRKLNAKARQKQVVKLGTHHPQIV